MSKQLAAIVAEAVDRKLTAGRVTPSDITLYVENVYADAVQDEAGRLIRNALQRQVKDELRRRADEDDGQDTLPGLGLPSAIFVRDDEDYYVATEAATWDELVAGRDVRVDNIRHAERRLTQYDDALDRLRPHMEGTGKSVVDALAAMQSAGDAA